MNMMFHFLLDVCLSWALCKDGLSVHINISMLLCQLDVDVGACHITGGYGHAPLCGRCLRLSAVHVQAQQ